MFICLLSRIHNRNASIHMTKYKFSNLFLIPAKLTHLSKKCHRFQILGYQLVGRRGEIPNVHWPTAIYVSYRVLLLRTPSNANWCSFEAVQCANNLLLWDTPYENLTVTAGCCKNIWVLWVPWNTSDSFLVLCHNGWQTKFVKLVIQLKEKHNHEF